MIINKASLNKLAYLFMKDWKIRSVKFLNSLK